MYILSQDKKQLINCESQKFIGFQIVKEIGRKGTYNIGLVDGMCILGKYEEEKQAVLEMQRLLEAIKNEEKCYEMH